MASYATRRQIWINIEKCLEWMVESGKLDYLLKLCESSLRMSYWSSRHHIPQHDLKKDDLHIAKNLVTSCCDYKLNAKQKEFLTDACLHYVYTYYTEDNEPGLSDGEVPDESQLEKELHSAKTDCQKTRTESEYKFEIQSRQIAMFVQESQNKIKTDNQVMNDSIINIDSEVSDESYTESLHSNNETKDDSVVINDEVSDLSGRENVKVLDDSVIISDEKMGVPLKIQGFSPLDACLTPKTSKFPLSALKASSPSNRVMQRVVPRKLFERDYDLDDQFKIPSRVTQSDDTSQNPLLDEEKLSPSRVTMLTKRFELRRGVKEPTQGIVHETSDPDSDSGESEVRFDIAGITKDINNGKVDHLLAELTKEQISKFWRLRIKSAEAAAHFYLTCLESDEEEQSEGEEEEEMHEVEEEEEMGKSEKEKERFITQRQLKKSISPMAIEEEEADKEEVETDEEMQQGCILTLKKGYKECMVCGKAVARLKRHMVSVHDMSEEYVAKEMQKQKELTTRKKNTRPLKDCPVRGCYSRVQRLDQHIIRVHKQDPKDFDNINVIPEVTTTQVSPKLTAPSPRQNLRLHPSPSTSRTSMTSSKMRDLSPRQIPHQQPCFLPTTSSTKRAVSPRRSTQEQPIQPQATATSESLQGGDVIEADLDDIFPIFMDYLTSPFALNKADDNAKMILTHAKKILFSIPGTSIREKMMPKNIKTLKSTGLFKQMYDDQKTPGDRKSAV